MGPVGRWSRYVGPVPRTVHAAGPVRGARGRRDSGAPGIPVVGGEALDVRTLGYVQTAKIPVWHVPGVFKGASGPGGQTTVGTCWDAYVTFSDELKAETGPCLVDDAYFGELVGRIGGTVFAIGDTTAIDPPASGMLELAVNDLKYTFSDNRGAFNVLFLP